ncbi:hypothetical protein BGX29_007300 [Mortierella sp. GBA35]|nr:hypothetical protein BGX29_007300 [Mortierella sp. GBA35]
MDDDNTPSQESWQTDALHDDTVAGTEETEASAVTESTQEQSPESEQEGSIPHKRSLPKGDDSNGSGEDDSPAPDSTLDRNDENQKRAESPPSPKKRRISLPGKSILKSAEPGDEEDLTGNQETTDATTVDNGELGAVDITETFSSTTEFLKRSRKSIGRRVSFAATARIRMFERDEKEDEHAKTMSFLEGLNPQIALDSPFAFQTGSQDNENNDTGNSMESASTNRDAQDDDDENTQNTRTSSGSSDSEKERSFEVNVAQGYSDTSGSEATAGLYLQSLLPTQGLGVAFDDDGDNASDSSNDEDVNYFPEAHLMKRSSGIGIYQDSHNDSLGPQVDIGQPGTVEFGQPNIMEFGQPSSGLFSHREDNLDGGTGDMSLVSEDLSMDYRFQKHRSSLPERPPTPFGQDHMEEDSTTDFTNEHQSRAGDVGSSSNEQLSHGPPGLGALVDIVNQTINANANLSFDMMDEHLAGDEDTDMDITAPIGTGIQELAQEIPPIAFHSAEDHTAMFSDLGTPMDMTQPIGVGIVESFEVISSSQQELAPQPEEPKDTANIHTFHSTTGDRVQPSSINPPRNNANSSTETADKNDIADEHTHRNRFSFGNNEHSRDYSSSADKNQLATSPRRLSFNDRASLRASFGATDAIIEPSHIMTPGRLERQSRDILHPSFNEPVFQPPHVSPETSNLAKKIHRFSVGEPSGQAEESHGGAAGGRDDTMDFLLEQKHAQRSSADVARDGGDISRDHTNDYSVGAPEAHPEAADTSYDAGGDEDSIIELPPISLNQFLSLVGISFLDQLYASTRRRTIPHQSSSSEPYRSADLIKAKAIFTQELNSYRDACRLLKQSIEKTRAFTAEQEKKVMKRNPDYFREFRESNSDSKEFMKDRLKMVKVHAKLDTNVHFCGLKSELLERQQASLEEHLDKLKKDITNLGQLSAELAKEKGKVTPRHAELKRIVEQATKRRRAYAQCDKEQLRLLTEAVDEQGTQIEHFKSVNERKEKELAEVRARVAQLRLSEQTSKARIATAEKTIQDNQYVRPEDVSQAKDRLSIIQAIHRWEPLRSRTGSGSGSANGSSSFALVKAAATGSKLEFVYDKSVVVTIEPAKIGKEPAAVKVTEFEEEAMMNFDLSLTDQKRLHISALARRTRPPMKEYFALLRDYTTMVAAKYKTGTTINKILSDVNQFWTKISLIRRDVELVRAHHVVDLVAGSAENLKELEIVPSPGQNQSQRRQLAAGTPVVLLDIRVRFTGPIVGSGARRGNGADNRRHPEDEPVKFYLWFTFTLSDLLSFPGPNSFTWRLELVYGEISHEHVAQAVGPCVKKGGYDVMRDICVKVNQLLRT